MCVSGEKSAAAMAQRGRRRPRAPEGGQGPRPGEEMRWVPPENPYATEHTGPFPPLLDVLNDAEGWNYSDEDTQERREFFRSHDWRLNRAAADVRGTADYDAESVDLSATMYRRLVDALLAMYVEPGPAGTLSDPLTWEEAWFPRGRPRAMREFIRDHRDIYLEASVQILNEGLARVDRRVDEVRTQIQRERAGTQRQRFPAEADPGDEDEPLALFNELITARAEGDDVEPLVLEGDVGDAAIDEADEEEDEDEEEEDDEPEVHEEEIEALQELLNGRALADDIFARARGIHIVRERQSRFARNTGQRDPHAWRAAPAAPFPSLRSIAAALIARNEDTVIADTVPDDAVELIQEQRRTLLAKDPLVLASVKVRRTDGVPEVAPPTRSLTTKFRLF